MRSFAFASIFALVLSSVSATTPREALDKQHNQGMDLSLNGYACGRNFYSMPHIDKTVEKACKEINKSRWIKRRYPKLYEPKDPKAVFKGVKGNKYMYPIFQKRMYSRLKRTRHDRVVLTKDCELAGLVKQVKGWKSRLTAGLAGQIKYTKCTKLYKNYT
ncbi:hypothetical protein K3495_g2490 [Podosphaera aphanis]|nr:hypothetical protein K3495_g2490 [Podosphaera aphanis]